MGYLGLVAEKLELRPSIVASDQDVEVSPAGIGARDVASRLSTLVLIKNFGA